LWDELLPVAALRLPADLALLDRLLCDPVLTAPFRRLFEERWPAAVTQGRPTLAIETLVRLMVIKQRTG
jgi:hypothetical protein